MCVQKFIQINFLYKGKGNTLDQSLHSILWKLFIMQISALIEALSTICFVSVPRNYYQILEQEDLYTWSCLAYATYCSCFHLGYQQSLLGEPCQLGL